MNKLFWSLVGLFLISINIQAQISSIPAHAKSNELLEIIFDAGKGNKALFGHEGEVYFHAGLITQNSTSTGDWKFVIGDWGKANKKYQMENLGGDKYRWTFNPRELFNVDDDIVLQQIAIVFRDAKGEKVGKTINESDFLIPLDNYKPALIIVDSLKYNERHLINYQWDNDKLLLSTNKGSMQYSFIDDKTIHAEFYSTNEIYKIQDVSIINQSGVQCHIKNANGIIYWGTDKMMLEIETNPIKVSYYYNKQLILAEELGFYERQKTSGIRFNLTEDEAIYGTGERAVPLNRRGYKFDLYNKPDYNYGKNAKNLNYSMPVVLSSNKYLLFIDNYQKATIDIGEAEQNIMEFNSIGGVQQYYIIGGDSDSEISSSFTNLVGRQPIPPRWALGNLQSRMAYRTQDEVENVVNTMIEKDFPLDAIILDFYWFGDSIKGYLGNLKWYEKNWPEPEKMIKDFKEKGVKTILITEPFIIDSSYWFQHTDTAHLLATHKNGDSYVMKEFYFGHAGLLDIFKQETKDWFWEQYKKQIDIGVAGWWGDLGEPETHPSDMFHVNGKAEEVHNIYAHEWASMLHNKYKEFYPNTRLFHLNRSGATGTQRYSIFTWSGDVSRTWSGFQAQIPLMLNMSLCGLAYSSSDLGGFALGEKDEELYTRWLQMGVFNPIFRPHGSDIPSEPIFYSQETQDIVRQSIKLRYRLIPYLYNAAYENTVTGKPIVKPFFYYHKNQFLNNYSGAYYFGDEIIVAPIIEKGITSQEVFLPNGWWYDFYTGELFEGDKNLEVEVNIEKIPAFIKAGSFVPMLNDYSTTDKYPDHQLYIHYYPSIDTIASIDSLFEDDGDDALNLETENYQIINFKAKNSAEELDISLSRNRMSYSADQSDRRIIWVLHNIELFPIKVILNDEKIRVYNSLQKPKIQNIDAKYDQFKKELYINMPFDSDQINIKIIKDSL